MSAFASLKKNLHWAGLALLAALIAAIAYVAPSQISRLELQREARVAADRLQAQLLKEPDALFHALTHPSLAPQFAAILDKSGYGHRVLRYELYDEKGALAFTSGLAGLSLDGDVAGQIAKPSHEPAKVILYTGSSGSTPSQFAAVTLPLALNGEPRGTLVVYLDQSDQAVVLSNYFGLIAAITLFLLAIGIAAPAAFAWMRGQERRRAVAKVHYLETHDELTGLSNRRAFGERLAEVMVRMHRDRTQIAVL